MKRFYVFLLTAVIYLFLLPAFLILFWILIAIQILLAPVLASEWLISAFKDIVIYANKLSLKQLQNFTKHDKHLMDTPLIEYKWFKSPMERRRKMLWKGLLMYEYKVILNDKKFGGSMSSFGDINDHMDMRKIVMQDTTEAQQFLHKEMELSNWLQAIWDNPFNKKDFNFKLRFKLFFNNTTPTIGEYSRWNLNTIKQIASELDMQTLPNLYIQPNSLEELDKLFYQFTPKINKQPMMLNGLDGGSRGEIMMQQPLESAESIDEFLEFVPILRKTASARELKSPQKSCLKQDSSSNGSSPTDKLRRVSFASDSQEHSPTHSL